MIIFRLDENCDRKLHSEEQRRSDIGTNAERDPAERVIVIV
jgi:hypothetical protein